MKRWAEVLIVLCAVAFLTAPVFAQGERPGQARATAYASTPNIDYDSAPNFLKLPTGTYLGEVMGVARDSKGNIFAYNRNGEDTRLFQFDAEGNFTREIGQGLYAFAMAHGVRVDSEDNIWAVDEGTDMVVKFNPQGRVMMLLGRRPEFGEGINQTAPFNAPVPPAKPYNFGRPTDIAWDKAGDIFISDGYTNSRVVKYDKWGKFIKEVGTKGTEPNEFNTPHSIQTDNNGNVYVADRGNNRIQVFSNDLTLRAIYTHVGSPWAICITPGPHQYLYSSNSNADNNDSRQAAVSGEIYKMELDGTVLGKFGEAGKLPKQFTTVHAMDCRDPNNILTAEITGWRVQKIELKGQGMAAPAKK
jgi:hypothetical protein